MGSWRVSGWVEVEVTADTYEDAIEAGRSVIAAGDFDLEQLTLDSAYEVDPETALPLDTE